MMKGKRTFNNELVLVGILLLGAVVRFWGIDFGMPHDLARPDEQHYIGIAFQLLNGGPTTEYFYEYPSLFFYVMAAGLVGFYVLGRLVGVYSGVDDFIFQYANDPASLHFMSRGFSAIIGVLTIYGVYKTTRRLFKSEKTGLVGALFMALCYLHVRDSHFGTMDVSMTCLIVASFHFIVKSYDEWNLKNYLLAGLLAGLATSTKYAGAFLVFPMCLLHLFKVLEHNMPFFRIFMEKRIWGFAAAMILGFLAGTPYFLTEYPKYLYYIVNRVDLMDSQSPKIAIGWWYHLKFSLWHGLGWGMYLAAFAGLVLCFIRDWKKASILLAFPLTYYLFVGKGYVVFLRYVVPVLPFMCIAATYLVYEVYQFLKEKLEYQYVAALTGVLIVIILFQGCYNLLHFNYLITKKDSRELGKEWVEENIPQGSSVYQFTNGSNFCRLQLRPNLETLEKRYNAAVQEGEKGRLQKARIDHWKRSDHEGFKNYTFKDTLNQFVYNGQPINSPPDYVIIHYYPLIEFMPPPKHVQELIATQYTRINEIQTVNPEHPENKYDQHDAFFLPFAGFREVERMGPNMLFYKKL